MAYPSVYRFKELGRVRAFTVNPIFLSFTPYIFRSIMRQCQKKALFYQAKPDTDLPAMIKHFMMPIRPRRNPLLKAGSSPNSYHFGGQSLSVISCNRLNDPRAVVNTKIVIVGSGSTAVSLLEELCFDQRYAFTNITLISPTGLQHQVCTQTFNLCIFLSPNNSVTFVRLNL